MFTFGLSEERAGTVIDMPSHMVFTLPKYEYRECKQREDSRKAPSNLSL